MLEIGMTTDQGIADDWRKFMENEAIPDETPVEVHAYAGDFKEIRIQLGEMPAWEDMLRLEESIKAGDWEYARECREFASLDPEADFAFIESTGNESYGAADCENLAAKYPGFDASWIEPLLYSDFDMYERRGFLWLASRATVDGMPAMLCRAAPNALFFAYSSERGFAWSLLDRDTGRYSAWSPGCGLAVPYGKMCAKFIDGIQLPEESCMGIDWIAAAKKLRKMNCLLRYESDFFWHDRNALLMNDAIAVAARETDTHYFENREFPDGANGIELARNLIRSGDATCEAIMILGNGKCRIRDVRKKGNVQRLARQGQDMIPAHLHPFGRDAPLSRIEIDLPPQCAA